MTALMKLASKKTKIDCVSCPKKRYPVVLVWVDNLIRSQVGTSVSVITCQQRLCHQTVPVFIPQENGPGYVVVHKVVMKHQSQASKPCTDRQKVLVPMFRKWPDLGQKQIADTRYVISLACDLFSASDFLFFLSSLDFFFRVLRSRLDTMPEVNCILLSGGPIRHWVCLRVRTVKLSSLYLAFK